MFLPYLYPINNTNFFILPQNQKTKSYTQRMVNNYKRVVVEIGIDGCEKNKMKREFN